MAGTESEEAGTEQDGVQMTAISEVPNKQSKPNMLRVSRKLVAHTAPRENKVGDRTAVCV